MTVDSNIELTVKKSIIKLIDYCKKNNWAGFDPFDGLNSRIFAAFTLINNRIGRLIFIQGMKRSPINFRHIFFVPKEKNPKGLALFCLSLFILSNLRMLNDENLIIDLLKQLIRLRSPQKAYYCWGYNFDWQNRSVLLPKYEPNIVTTTFAGNALIDAYEKYAENKYLDMAISAGHFLRKGLNIARNEYGICFSYTPFDQGLVHNANLLGAAFLSRIYSITKEEEFLEFASQAVRFTINKQNDDGSWFYGEHKTQKWIDNFHTGYNLVALKKFHEYTEDEEFKDNIEKGFKFYKENFFTHNEDLPKYYHDCTYPIDIHSVAQSIITLAELEYLDDNSMDHATHILSWAINNMQSKKGYFFYQKRRFYKNRISYMRWSQAWMLYAMSIFMEKIISSNND